VFVVCVTRRCGADAQAKLSVIVDQSRFRGGKNLDNNQEANQPKNVTAKIMAKTTFLLQGKFGKTNLEI
jgi:hypothetical protein